MTFRQSINQFRTDYNHICLSNDIREINLNEKEVFLNISKAYAELSFTERLIEKKGTVDLVLNQYEYTTGAGASNIPELLLDIVQVRFNDAGSNMVILDEVSYEDMPTVSRPGGLPTQWTLHGTNDARKLIINTLPDQSYTSSNGYRLTILYREKVMLYSGTAEDSFSSLDFSSATGGGNWLSPTEWDELIIMKAICRVLPINLRQGYLTEASLIEQRLRQTKTLIVESKMPYYL